MRRIHALTAVAAATVCLDASPAAAQYGAPAGGEWRSYAGDSGGTKYSPLDQITAENFGDLEVRWRWNSADSHLVRSTPGGDSLVAADTLFDVLQGDEPDLWTAWDGVRQTRTRPSIRSLVATPLMVDGVLYVSNPRSTAPRPSTPGPARRGGCTTRAPTSRACRPSRSGATAAWRTGRTAATPASSGAPATASSWPSTAETGLPAPDFGDNGRIDLTDGVPRATRGERDVLNLLALSSQSPPMILRDTIVVGSTINDRTITREATPGWARAYDIRTGRHKWDFHTVPQSADEFGVRHLAERVVALQRQHQHLVDDERRRGARLGVPAHRHADQRLLRRAPAGGQPVRREHRRRRRRDRPAAVALPDDPPRPVGLRPAGRPNLLDVTVDGREIKAVAQVSKQGSSTSSTA